MIIMTSVLSVTNLINYQVSIIAPINVCTKIFPRQTYDIIHIALYGNFIHREDRIEYRV